MILFCKNYTHNIELNSHSLVQETGSRLTPYHRPCFARQPRSTSFPPIPLEIKSNPKRTQKKFVKKIIFILAHILVAVNRFFYGTQSVCISFLSVYFGNIFQQKQLSFNKISITETLLYLSTLQND